MDVIDVIVSILVIAVLSIFAFSPFILASREDDSLEHIEFKDGDNNEQSNT